MLALAERLLPWLGPGRPSFAVATVVSASGSTPSTVGTAMAVRSDGVVLGSLSGGCVEGAVHVAALDAIHQGGCLVERFDCTDDSAFAVGLPCGGDMEVHVQPVRAEDGDDPAVVALMALAGNERGLLVRRLDTVRPTAVFRDLTAVVSRPDDLVAGLGELVPSHLAPQTVVAIDDLLTRSGAVVVHVPDGRGTSDGRGTVARECLLVESRVPAARFLVVGSNHFARALVSATRLLGYHVTLVDPRAVFTTRLRFPEADDVVVDWPHRYLAAEARAGRLDRRTGIAVMTHDAKIDVPVLRGALELDLAYVGAMGSRRSHEARVAALRDSGVPEPALATLRSPIGMDLGAETPSEVAVSVVAELVAAAHGRSQVGPLCETDGPVHGLPRADGIPWRTGPQHRSIDRGLLEEPTAQR
ncbi:XdhC family protein [Isoptericola sp. NPDC056134]|uniref:XdhC family protein n=1 Tax=Isoptericola sp. NPDC056134 TaxID=3345723 RepID=UPI0035E518BB